MSKLNETNMQSKHSSKDILLDFTVLSEPELDYEYTESLLESSESNSKLSSKKSITSTVETNIALPNVASTVEHAPSSSKYIHLQQQTTNGTANKFQLQLKEQDVMAKFQNNTSTTSDMPDIHLIADKISAVQTDKLKGRKQAGFDFEMVISVDKLLEEAYLISERFQKKLDYATRARVLNLILKLKELPHLYEHVHLRQGKSARVLDWLNSNINRPEPELSISTRQEPVQIRKFVYSSDIQPRISLGDTNGILGKRKRRNEDYGNGDCIQKMCSNININAQAECSRSGLSTKRRKRVGD